MGNKRRTSVENMFANKGSVQPQKKGLIKEEPKNDIPEKTKVKEEIIEEETVAEEIIQESISEMIDDKGSEIVEPIKTEQIHEEVKEGEVKNEPKETVPANIDSLFSKKKKERGKQQTVYLKKEVYDFCNDIAEKYELGMSDVINKLILSLMEEE